MEFAMKNTIILILISLITLIGHSQNPKGQVIITSYYLVKDALVQGDSKLAASGANELVKEISGFDVSDKKVQLLSNKVKIDASKIAGAGSLADQREAFTSLSANLLELIRLVDLSSTPIYQFYCPMKKAIWLSSESAIKNPYFGKQMLTCGSLQETLK